MHQKQRYEVPKPPPEPPPAPTFEELLLHKNDKIIWSDLDWLTNYNPLQNKDNTPDYRKCKLLGSLLDTEKDIDRRKILTIDAMKKHKHIFNSNRISIQLKIRCFNAYISSIFLYNSELWFNTQSIQDNIDIFHRKQLRYALNIYYPKIISNTTLYEMTKDFSKVKLWSTIIKQRRLNGLDT